MNYIFSLGGSSMGAYQCFSTRSDFASQGTLAMSGDTFDCHDQGDDAATQRVEARDEQDRSLQQRII